MGAVAALPWRPGRAQPRSRKSCGCRQARLRLLWRRLAHASRSRPSSAVRRRPGLADFELESATEVERHGFAFLLVQAAPRGVDCLPARQHFAGVIADSAYERLPGNAARPTDLAERTVDLILEWAKWDRVSNPRPQSGGEGGVLERRLRCTAL